MPHTTFAYLFELKVAQFGAELAQRLRKSGRDSFFMTLDAEGRVEKIFFTPPPKGWHDFMEPFERDGTSFFFFDPFDAPDYTYISWQGVSRTTMERFIGAAFLPEDFVASLGVQDRAEKLPGGTFPETWGVMF